MTIGYHHMRRRLRLRLMRMRELGLNQHFTAEVGINSVRAPSPPSSPAFFPACAQGNPPAPSSALGRGSPRFKKGNPWRWKPGESGNPRGRARRNARDEQRDAQLSLEAQKILWRLEIMGKLEGFRPPRRLLQFKALYEITRNAHRSALIAGYSPKTAKSKAYLLARRVKGGESR
jgi:hypothetical protein